MIHCKELNKSFVNKNEMFKEIVKNKEEIISFKKSQIQKSFEKGGSLKAKVIDSSKLTEQIKGVKFEDNYYYIAVNSTRILDSHSDLHLDPIWDFTVKAQQGKNYLVDTHVLSIGTTIARKEHIEMFTAKVPFSVIGKNYKGDTVVLIYKIAKDKIIDKKAKEWLDSGDDIEASVRMQYVTIEFCLNSTEKGDETFLSNFEKYYPIIANKEDFEEEIYYFWAISEAKNINESSLVLFGSNNATGQIVSNEDTKAAEQALYKQEADAQSLQRKQLLTNILNN
ncbi:structural protein [Polaribacter phage Freya_1]|uniref:Structural protein n=1 Tax=Polaribacter phage Freya_1 TaxID=2745662 RepID=A0A8E4ZKE6_9CAUD|nr:structural protein [Polaribacter phage Freya_1]QQV90952.1 structural protein [Polaribacter phage Freya_2]QQV91020.1 structural protein [Polaribacter phage Freya_3]QQV91088.1 structural protein [Polaribacter phage Freya_4]QQV91163.1 structural protein [Polaribacter phage Freya_8]QQV91240.1 structural protein [Polaribacter phage Freya_9]QQV91318.1 structural protein [Polaribacter phage Freya_10]QYV99897.1 structural protein [Polaribacter phage Freya_5]QYV99967.1 structural protein [Polarib